MKLWKPSSHDLLRRAPSSSSVSIQICFHEFRASCRITCMSCSGAEPSRRSSLFSDISLSSEKLSVTLSRQSRHNAKLIQNRLSTVASATGQRYVTRGGEETIIFPSLPTSRAINDKH